MDMSYFQSRVRSSATAMAIATPAATFTTTPWGRVAAMTPATAPEMPPTVAALLSNLTPPPPWGTYVHGSLTFAVDGVQMNILKNDVKIKIGRLIISHCYVYFLFLSKL